MVPLNGHNGLLIRWFRVRDPGGHHESPAQRAFQSEQLSRIRSAAANLPRMEASDGVAHRRGARRGPRCVRSGDPVRHAGRCPAERVRRPRRDRTAGRRRRSMCGLTMATAAAGRATRRRPLAPASACAVSSRRARPIGRARDRWSRRPRPWAGRLRRTRRPWRDSLPRGRPRAPCRRVLAPCRQPTASRSTSTRRSQGGTDDLAVLGHGRARRLCPAGDEKPVGLAVMPPCGTWPRRCRRGRKQTDQWR